MSKSDNSVRIEIDGKPFTEYHFQGERPYFFPVIGPSGENVTRNWPLNDSNPNDQKDHPHHKGLWFTHGDVNGHDFWHKDKIVQTASNLKSVDKKQVLETKNNWVAQDGSIVCNDTREHSFSAGKNWRAIDFKVTIHASNGKVVFKDTKEGSMAIRLAPTLRVKGKVAKGKIENSEGVKNGNTWGKRAKWVNYSGPLNDKNVGVVIFDHPQNPRHPTWWHVRDYGLFAANPFGASYFEKKPKGTGDLVIEANKSQTFHWRILVYQGQLKKEQIEKHFKTFAGK